MTTTDENVRNVLFLPQWSFAGNPNMSKYAHADGIFEWKGIRVRPVADRGEGEVWDYIVAMDYAVDHRYATLYEHMIVLLMEPKALHGLMRPPGWDAAIDGGLPLYYYSSRNVSNWHLSASLDELLHPSFASQKRETGPQVSMVVSGKRLFAGHVARLNLANGVDRALKAANIDLDVYGRMECDMNAHKGFRSYLGAVEQKETALLQYKYTIAIENSKEKGYFTEKLTDGLLTKCIVFYWGCPNIFEYFPGCEAVIVPFGGEEELAALLAESMAVDTWEKNNNSGAWDEARRLCLADYNVLAAVAESIISVEAAASSRHAAQ